ncbi:MAG: hypothetical protein ABJM29_09855 [Rhizobiaceae bacterium]
MNCEFISDPEQYRAESQASSRIWTLWLPIAAFIFIPILAWYDRDFFFTWFDNETHGLLEFLHFLLPLITALIGLRLAFSKLVRSDPFIMLWCIAMFLGGVYLAGEEASWGQHYFGWTTPDAWLDANDQQETNLHNISNVLDQLPRGILVGGIVVTGLIYPWLLLNRPGFLPARFNFTYPPLALVPLALVTSACWIYRGLRKGTELSTFLVYRPGEFQELFIVWFLCYYALFLLWRERRCRSQA